MASRIQQCSSFDEAKRMLDAGLLWLRYSNGPKGGWFKHDDTSRRPRWILEVLAGNGACWWTVDKFGYMVEEDDSDDGL